MPIQRTCLQCGKLFFVPPSKVKEGKGNFCCKTCANLHKTGIKHPTSSLVKFKCKNCGSTVIRYPSQAKGGFCGKACYWADKKGKPSLKRDRVTVVCRICGDLFEVNRARFNRGHANYCSTKCAGAARKGSHLSEATKMKLSSALRGRKGKPMTAERIELLSALHRGKPSWNKGRQWTDKEKQKLSLAHTRGIPGLQRAQEIARQQGLDLLSTDYKSIHSKLQWRCKKGHVFESSLAKVHSGQGCPYCLYKNEQKCRDIFQDLFGVPFKKTKPKWLAAWKGVRLELDGYNEQLHLAFEYQGQQHYAQHRFFHSKRTLGEQKLYDMFKRDQCEANNVTLLEIPYTVKPEEMRRYIIAQCTKKGITLPA
jgi:hypothetical protein